MTGTLWKVLDGQTMGVEVIQQAMLDSEGPIIVRAELLQGAQIYTLFFLLAISMH